MVLAFLIVALLTRAPYFGNPDYHVDEEFYFLVADRMWHGDLPFVDIWDRKPMGLFLIYAALWPLRQTDLLAVQIVALLFAVGTAWALWAMARRLLSPLKAAIPGLLYLLWLPTFSGANGQSPVFYNLFMACAALLLLRAGDRAGTDRAFQRLALGAMLLVGLAIQVKYTAIVEGAFFGCYVVGLAAARGAGLARIARIALLGALCAFGPTLAVLLFYAALGHLDTFLFANFLSIFRRARLQEQYLSDLITFVAVVGFPLFLFAFGAALKILFRLGRVGQRPVRERVLLIGWAISAFGGFLSVGNFYDHYTLPLLAPLLALCACLFEAWLPTLLLSTPLALWAAYWSPKVRPGTTAASRAAISRLAEEIRPYLSHGGMFIYDGPSILYATAGARPITRFAYPDHLSNVVEEHALDVDTGREMARILAARPAVIVTSDHPIIPVWNGTTRAQILPVLARHYVATDRVLNGWGYRSYILHVRRDLLPAKNQP